MCSSRIKDLRPMYGVEHPKFGYLQYLGEWNGGYEFWHPEFDDFVIKDGDEFVEIVATDRASEESLFRNKLNLPPSKMFEYIYPMFAKDFLMGRNWFEFLTLVLNHFDLDQSQIEALKNEWDLKEKILS